MVGSYDLEKRQSKLNKIQAIIDELIENKDKIDELVLSYDIINVDNTGFGVLRHIGKPSTVIGMCENVKQIMQIDPNTITGG